jgi:NADPH:quinone reductase-like Zn-dependent oxidoreductase
MSELPQYRLPTWLGLIPSLSRTSRKNKVLMQAGAAAVIATTEQDVTQELNAITQDNGVNVVFDPVMGLMWLNWQVAWHKRGNFSSMVL